jgi:hypothetical protein
MSDTQAEPAVAAAPAKEGSPSTVVFKGELEIFPSRPLPGLVPEPLQAFAGKSRRGGNIYAILCDRHLVPRLESLHKYLGIEHEGLPKLLGSGALDWPSDKTQYYSFIYEHTQGRPLTPDSRHAALAWKEEHIRHIFLKQIVPILQEMRFREMSHGQVRLSNIFTIGDVDPSHPGNIDKLMLGDCLALPYNYAQPPIYLPIERVMAAPAGRGEGGFEDDMYALGVCIAQLIRATDPNLNATDREIFERKVELGSFITLIGKNRVSGILLELMRGLLQDDPLQRWTVEDVLQWMEGRRIAPKAGAVVKTKASRPFTFAGKTYIRPTLLAAAIAEHPNETVGIIESGDLDNWISRSLEDKNLSKKLDAIVHIAHDSLTSPSYADRLATLVALALAPQLPLMYKGLHFHAEGFGRLLVQAYGKGAPLTPYAEVLRSRLLQIWAEHGEIRNIDAGILQQRLVACSSSIKQTGLGHGLERCAYTLVPDAPCLSDLYAATYVRSTDDVLPAIDTALANKQPVEQPLDRQLAAFILCRDPSSIDKMLFDLTAAEPYRKIDGTLRVLARLQTRLKDKRFPAVTAWLASHLNPLINRFHDRKHREQVKAEIEKLKGGGDIRAIMAIFDDANQRNIDTHEFNVARNNYLALGREYDALSRELALNKRFGYSAGREIAAMVAATICFLVVVAFLVMRFTGGINV